MALQRPKGTQDHLPDGSPKLSRDVQAAAFAFVQDTTRRVLERAGAQFINTPLFEEAELVKRGVGGSTDIVRKEMFTVYYFGDHGGYVLRPEGTASIVRAYLQNGLKQLPAPLKLWTHGPMFRAENVQKGRLRQFHQVDYEVLGSTDPLVDAEAIWLMWEVVRELGLTGVRVKLGSIGDPEDREAYNAYLRELFTPHEGRLSDDSRDRLTRNPMRILDSKSEGDQALIRELNVKPMLDFLGEEARAHFEAVQRYLTAWDIPFDIDPSIVRGLDYYRRTAWELHHEGVGAKSALGGGGRYDGLAAQLGGPEVPGIGWAFGIERLLLALEAEGVAFPETGGPLLFLAAMDEENVGLAARLALQGRRVARVEFAYRALKPGNAFKEADRRRARYAAIIGSDEAARGVLNIKNLASGEQQEVALPDLNTFLAERV
ncbi:histidine--tRNA ligase [Deinococcus metallilatus]|uniref:Histidine--tRNA ligase n=1 Tax=Deinococcus metallilatus TaxID=1211322 RepID=A0AAJ5K5E4_9DEIO|nr:histidine--tRNA ligase [Deinococcus metallilatus]MBB5294109.1 histidyl-tRNA synthetase [Deinococcus metallilatus]QBY08894.1 histidine--tRNA ligase [Deinococcus metallilatus]RXJ10038.1 histidine--tRNA ligase [Deinococcus metallilatus]TLK28025.1 histidine--tRNA ligase [Deinococcus metallilatus]GMA16555.1 histidine--tRNA ligase [Deinococcus metallilatus]